METPKSDEEALQVKEYTFQYPRTSTPILKNISFSLKEGEFGLIVGPGSCGKSTLCTSINNVLKHVVAGSKTSGKIIIYGKDIAQLPLSEVSKEVAIVFQNPDDQMCELAVTDEVGFGPSNLLVPRDEIFKRIDEALSTTGMMEYKDRVVTELSGGEKQRIAVAGSLAMEPRILLLDNPTSNLDPLGVRNILTDICSIREKKDITIIMVAVREIEDVIHLVDRVLLLNRNGELIFNGNSHEWIEKTGALCKEQLGLWIPQVSEIAMELKKRGAPIKNIPLTVDEAFKQMKGKIEIHPEIIEDKIRAEEEALKKGEPVVSLKDVNFSYPTGTHALRGVSMQINRGEMVALIGQNGAGKSTLSLVLTNFLNPSSGDVTVLGKNTKDLGPGKVTPNLGYAFQYPDHQFVDHVVYDDIAYPLKLRKDPPEAIEKKVMGLLKDMDLVKHKKSLPLTLSMGEKRRLSVIDVLVAEPEIIILDEPTFGLDYTSAIMCMNIMKRLNEQGRTLILVSHDMRIVAEYARHTFAMSAGKIIFDGSTRDLYAKTECLDEASLCPPPVFMLARLLNDEAKILTIQEFLEVANWRR